MNAENETPETDVPQGEVDIKEEAKRILDNLKARTKDIIKNAMNHLANVKVKTVARYKQLEKASKTKHEKIMIMGNIEWKDTPPRELIGNLSMNINGGVGKITYIRFLKDPDTGHALKEATPDGTEIGGNIKSHYVEETLEPAQVIRIKEVPISGCPTAKEGKKNMENARQMERNRVKKARGLN